MKTKAFIFILQVGIIFIVFLNINETKGQQFWEWDIKRPLTDSVSDNNNLDMLHQFNGNQEMLNLVWENSPDPSSTAIFYHDLLSTDEPQALVSSPGVHFTHPKLLRIEGIDFLFYVLYQSDQNGSQDIFYLKYSVDRQFSGPFPFAAGEGDEMGLAIGNDSYYNLSMGNKYIRSVLAWINDGTLLSCNLEENGGAYSFSEPVTIDTGNCSNAVVVNNYMIYYIRNNELGRFIFVVYMEDPAWSEPYIYFNGGDCYNLSQDKVEPRFLTWSADSNGVYRNFIAESFWMYDGYPVGPESDAPLDPAICTIAIAIEPQPLEFFDYYMAFPYPENGNYEIFMNSLYQFPPVYENFSQSQSESRNPDFYLGENDSSGWWCFYVYLTWEELQNDHWQIFYSRTLMCYGSVDEKEQASNYIKAYPTPFRDEVTVSYTLKSGGSINIELVDLYGRRIRELYNGKQLAGKHEIQWNGKEVPPGLYFIHLSSDRISSSTRVLKIN